MLKELKEQLEQAKSHGEKELPQWVREDERFRLLLRMLEKRVANRGNTGRAAAREGGEGPERVLQICDSLRGWRGP